MKNLKLKQRIQADPEALTEALASDPFTSGRLVVRALGSVSGRMELDQLDSTIPVHKRLLEAASGVACVATAEAPSLTMKTIPFDVSWQLAARS